ncbi:MAG: hypothetical protein PHN49_05765 [Candidatus Omnitrophica bacterium]|nr:hypothetical protein [Candidatus Omnitrophota bacterium]MDD5671124.1 hypothetical protein [Candidatus Omnitrophota bacterium]
MLRVSLQGRGLFFLAMTCLLVIQGCQTGGKLELETAASYKAKKKTAAESETAQEALTAEEKKRLRGEYEKVLTESQEVPPEMVLLELPPSFVRLSDTHLLSPEAKNVVDGLLPNATAVWGSPEWGMVMMAAKAAMDSEKIKAQTRERFLLELKVVGQLSEQYYKFRKDAKTSFQIDRNGNLLVLKFTGTFTSQGEPQTHLRYFFYYRPDYRFDFFVAGKTDDIKLLQSDIDSQINAFEAKLNLLFSQGIPFRPSRK